MTLLWMNAWCYTTWRRLPYVKVQDVLSSDKSFIVAGAIITELLAKNTPW